MGSSVGFLVQLHNPLYKAAEKVGRQQDRVVRNLDCQMDQNTQQQTAGLKRALPLSLLALSDKAA